MERQLADFIASGQVAFALIAMGKATIPDVDTVRIGGTVEKPKKATVVRCTCKPRSENSQYHRLGDGRAIICPECGTTITRVGYKIVAANW